jgi:hypothetical protein
MIVDQRQQMSLEELLEQLHLRFPEEVASFENEHEDALENLEFGTKCDDELLDDLKADLISRLSV